jgi:hypothetical protein
MDGLILSYAGEHWRKVAMIMGKVLNEFERAGIERRRTPTNMRLRAVFGLWSRKASWRHREICPCGGTVKLDCPIEPQGSGADIRP